MTVGFKKRSGLDLKLEGIKLILGKEVKVTVPSVRTLKEMKPVLQNKNAKGKAILYYIHRGICLKKHAKIFKKTGIRYDITVMEAGKIGNEFIKTFGHFHPEARKSLSFPEIYEVIYGKAECAMQRKNDFVVVKAKAGEKILIPPNYGHLTINVGKTPLVMANIQADNFKANYTPFKKKRGAIYYRTKKWEKNKDYKSVPKIRFVQPSKFGRKPLYDIFVKNPKQFLFLKKP